MPNAEKVDCEKCQGTGTADFAGFGLDTCRWCDGKGTIEQFSKVAAASLHWRSGKSLDSLGADGQEVATVNNSLTVQTQERLEGLRQWADDNCPEGVAGITDDVRWLLSYAESVAAADLKQRLSDAVTLLYTHGVITEKMRTHARRNL